MSKENNFYIKGERKMITKIQENVWYSLDVSRKFANPIFNKVSLANEDIANEYRITSAFDLIDDIRIIECACETSCSDFNAIVEFVHHLKEKSIEIDFNYIELELNIKGSIYIYNILDNTFSKKRMLNNRVFYNHCLDGDMSEDYWISLIKAYKDSLSRSFKDTCDAYENGSELIMLLFFFNLFKEFSDICYDDFVETQYLLTTMIE